MSFIFKVRSLWLGLILSFIRALVRVLELVAIYWLSTCRFWFRIAFNFLITLYEGTFLLLANGLMGLLGLCSFNRTLSVGGAGYF